MTNKIANGPHFKDRINLCNQDYQDYYAGKRILVTGAGGSIGSELCEQLARAGAAQVIMLDSSEYNLYEVDQRMRATGHADCLPLIGDVRHTFVMQSVFKQFKPEAVVHAAALKHVPMLEIEHNMIEGVRTNVSGTKVLAECVAEYDCVESFTLISTDKAVNPTSFMGLTKRCAEKVMHMFDDSRFSIVRFGNVFGSSGSVVPLFEKQILAGGPVTVTHPGMTRYMMALPEAVGLVLASAALSADHKKMATYVLDMGEAVNISDLARALIRMHGMEPGEHIQIAYVGMRPGEKLEEELFYPFERIERTNVDGVLRAIADSLSMSDREAMLELLEHAEEREGEGVRHSLLKLVPEYQDEQATLVRKERNGSQDLEIDTVAISQGLAEYQYLDDRTEIETRVERTYTVGDWIAALSARTQLNEPNSPNPGPRDHLELKNGSVDFTAVDTKNYLNAMRDWADGRRTGTDRDGDAAKKDD